MPGQRSLTERQYYAHPQNAFWWIVSKVFQFPSSLTYDERADQLRKAGVALWDVLYDCERQGSLDSSIERHSEQANDFDTFFSNYPSIKRIVFNGQAAEKIFRRHCGAFIKAHSNVTTRVLPSTSPAYASMTKEQKLKIWRSALR